ncbi:MAG: NHL repeat-containing protein [Candidatus Eisenbacteria bacterium]|uniref:NHL repeat-containing protein n=1 Tax=Eiseniibacteriota bacterium TaxID=2212470 RepID=A0A933SE50_UNCEI|nr:NHL repeat-containing protein [Candidatus Eisenbacteria bacterium]
MRPAVLMLAAMLSCVVPAQAGAAYSCADTLVLAGADGVLVEPAGVAVDAFGRAWVTDAARHRLLRFDANGTRLDEAGALGSEVGQFRRPGALAAWGASAMAVLDRENRRVVGYDTHARGAQVLVDLASPALDAALGRVDGVGLGSDAGGALYVADADRDRILVFDFAGAFQRAIGGYGSGAGAFRHLVAVASAPRGALVTLEWLAGGKVRGRGGARDSVRAAQVRVQWLDASGASLGHWELPGGDADRWSLAVDPVLARVVLAEGTSGKLWRFELRAGSLAQPLARVTRPSALAFSADGSLVVAEPGRLLRFPPKWDGACDPGPAER